MTPNSFTLLALAVVLAVSGCARTNETGSKGEQALVCPQCKIVAVTVHHRFGHHGPSTDYQDACPGCHGMMETLFREGKWKHSCSICKDSPYTCPLSHSLY